MRILIGLFIATALFLTGCTSDESPVATETVTVAPEISNDEAFVMVMRMESFSVGVSDEDLIEVGHLVCDNFEMGYDFSDIADSTMSVGFNAYEAGFIIGASTEAFCPEFS